VRQTWFSRRAIGLHVVILIVVPTFAGLCLWQVRRALGGNDLSWAYVFEWPFFAGYAIYMWWRLLHEIPTADGQLGQSRTGPFAGTTPENHSTGHATGPADESAPDSARDGDEADRAAYNEYLSDLAARGKRKQWR
jgi:hypothetical protein